MANICSAKFRTKITDRVPDILANINRERFVGCLLITNDEPLYWTISIPNYGTSSSLYISKTGRKIEWSHHYDQLMWWTMSTVMSKLLRDLDPAAKIADEGDDELAEPTFDRQFPSPLDWLVPSWAGNEIVRHVMKASTARCYEKTIPDFWTAATTINQKESDDHG